ncbi:DUF6625 family protein [Exiguobacterium sp. s26]|uniref:DUF6625 family protein n=1 Tax=Exiguobacterium sp. s26 TaxID=2751231 RepID=UPI001BE8AD60|nr:DUF6625 family protein [Exiguobacterium sp. s26]
MKIAVIIPYFGDLPKNFELWYHSCAQNKSIDWFLITDNEINLPKIDNIKITNMSIADINNRIQSEIGEQYKISKPYKLCDFKPFYGLIFKDFVVNYDFWGYCDMDLIFGDLNNFLPIEKLKKTDMFQLWGHFTLIKNDDILIKQIKRELNQLFNLDTILKSEVVWALDEFAMPAVMSKLNNIVLYNNSIIADIVPYNNKLYLSHCERKTNYIFRYDGKSIYGYYIDEKNTVAKKEFMYVHFQKRKLSVNVDINSNSNIYITENSISNIEKIDIKEFLNKKYNKVEKIEMKFARIKNTVNKIWKLITERNLTKTIKYRKRCDELFVNKSSI